mmetsp:Transcript_96074/g.311730  ORF Transcript_96074/g.311730 Transcript_96074/m.311730 type:complete len:354 (-) Transcript_96074:59-1120(-)
MAERKHEWTVAAEKDDIAKLQELKGTGLPHTDGKVRDGFVSAAERGCTKALGWFLAWGVDINCTDTNQRFALHAAARSGIPSSLYVLCERAGVDIEIRDSEGATALKVAIKCKQMEAVKALLMFDAQLPEDASAPGLAVCVRQVQMERLGQKLKKMAHTTEVTHDELTIADQGVWTCQREHQRLLRLREEQKSGKLLVRYDERLAQETAAAERSRFLESENSASINENRVEIVGRRSQLTSVLRELGQIQSEEAMAKKEDDKLRSELQERRDALSGIQSEIASREAVVQGEQDELANAEARRADLESEISEQRLFNADELAELEAAKRELEGWRADREAAFKLTAQAHKLLGN